MTGALGFIGETKIYTSCYTTVSHKNYAKKSELNNFSGFLKNHVDIFKMTSHFKTG